MDNDVFFNKIEKKTKVNKDTIVSLANRLQEKGLKDEETIRDIIKTLSNITGKDVTKEREDKIINAIVKDKVPKNIEKMF